MGLHKYLGVNLRQISHSWLKHIIYLRKCFQSAWASLCPQHRAEAVRQVRAGPEPGHRLRAPLQAQVLGQAHREGPGQLQEDARLVSRRQRDHAPQDPDPQEGGADAYHVELAASSPL